MATLIMGDYKVSIKALKGKEEKTEEMLNALSLWLRYGSYFMQEHEMRTLAKEPELFSEDIFTHLVESGFFGSFELQELEV